MAKVALHSEEDLVSAHFAYMGNRVKKLFPWVVFSYFICFAIELIYNENIDLLAVVGRSIFELSFTFMAGIRGSSMNALTWYLSAMILAEMILFPIVKAYKRLWTCIIAPIVMLIILGNFSHTLGYIGGTYTWAGIVYVGLLRAIMGIAAGTICTEIVQRITEKYRFTNFGAVILKMIKWISIISCIVYMHVSEAGKGDIIVFVLYFIWCIVIFLDENEKVCKLNKLYMNKYLQKMGTFSLLIYLNQYAALKLLGYLSLGVEFKKELLLYCIITMVFSVISYFCTPLLARVSNGVLGNIIEKRG